MQTWDVLIIGGGPAGLSSSIYTARARLKTLIFAGSPPGGQLMLTTEVENYPGFKSILGPDLVGRMRDQAVFFGVEIKDSNVRRIGKKESLFEIVDSSGQTYSCKAVIVAVGARAKWLGLDSEQRLIGKGVSACATCDGFFFKDKVVGVVGGGDTAMEEALTLTKFARKVYIIHRRDSFRASKIMQERVFANSKIEVIWSSQVKEVLGDQRVSGVRILQQGKEKDLELDGLFIAIGHKPDTDFLKDMIELDEKGYVITTGRVMQEYSRAEAGKSFALDEKKLKGYLKKFDLDFLYMTSEKGVFAAGDCVDFVYRQAATAVGMGVSAALEVERFLE